jgi:hypothetical protein
MGAVNGSALIKKVLINSLASRERAELLFTNLREALTPLPQGEGIKSALTSIG